jgi:hypothetical protein
MENSSNRASRALHMCFFPSMPSSCASVPEQTNSPTSSSSTELLLRPLPLATFYSCPFSSREAMTMVMGILSLQPMLSLVSDGNGPLVAFSSPDGLKRAENVVSGVESTILAYHGRCCIYMSI